ncbi:hypothetical protein Q0812_09275 [Brevundimonas sp. 2R-24]|uniref:Magnesium transporter MgtE intracellular domain-containing protein n=1 Tax=Peiella sedimenti TaxID=3061083 RepID=A0ABT8SM23_9CAUL|nr:hypothetical protein [Caulobacteraceae bacterium XZ-24]
MSRIPRILPLVAVAIGGVVAVRAIGAGPDLFQGARAFAAEVTAEAQGEAAPAEASSRPAPGVCAVSPEELARQAGLSPAELRVLQSLSERRGQLDARDADFATQLPLLAAAEQKLDERINTLNGLKGELQALLGQADARQQEETNRLVQVYSAMRPREAARVMATLDDEVRLPVAAAMRPRSLAAIMAQMEPAAARELTEKLARRFESQQLRARTQAATDGAPRTSSEAAVQAANDPARAEAPTQPEAQPAAAQPQAQRPRPRPAAQNRSGAQNRNRPAQAAQRPAAQQPSLPSAPQPYQPSQGAAQGQQNSPRQTVE